MNSSLTVLIQRSLHKIPAYRRPLIESIIRVDHAGAIFGKIKSICFGEK